MAMWSRFRFFETVVKQPSLDYHNWSQYLDLTADRINPWNYWGAGLFLSGLVCRFKVIFYLFFTEKQFAAESLFLFVI